MKKGLLALCASLALVVVGCEQRTDQGTSGTGVSEPAGAGSQQGLQQDTNISTNTNTTGTSGNP